MIDVDKGLAYLSSVDDKMKKLIHQFPKPVFESNVNVFSSLIKYLIYQQLSGRSALAIFNRYKGLFINDQYNNPFNVSSINDDDFRSVGLSRQKISYIRNVAEEFINQDFSDGFLDFSNQEVIDVLIKIKGVGPWTINMFLMFTLQREDVMPFGDLGIKKGFATYYKLKELPSINFMKEKSKLWSPFRTIASIYLWYLIDDGFEW